METYNGPSQHFVSKHFGQSDKKKLLTFFFVFFLVLSLLYRSQMVNFHKNLSYFKVPTFSRGV